MDELQRAAWVAYIAVRKPEEHLMGAEWVAFMAGYEAAMRDERLLRDKEARK